MPAPPVILYTRSKAGFYPGSSSSAGVPVINAGTIAIGAPVTGRAYMVYPAGQGDLTWQGGVFGLSAPDSGSLVANVWRVSIAISHFVSNPAAFSGVTAQVYDTNTSTVVMSQAFTLSSTMITETITLTSGYAAADVPDLAARLTWHQTGVGFAAVQHAYAEVSYSYSDSVGMLTTAGLPAITAPAVSVAPLPPVRLVSAGAVVSSFAPAFGQPTSGGDLLIAWVYSNGSSSSFSTTCSDPSWQLAGQAGAAFGWRSLWYKLHCNAAETAPVFSDVAASQPMSELLEFTPVTALDQVTGGTGSPSVTYTAPGPDTASGDLVFGFAAWNGSNAGPAAITLTGTDSSGTALALSTASNASSTGTQFWVTGWGQASAAAGPGADTMTASLGFFDGGGGLMASFKAAPAGIAALTVPSRRPGSRTVIVPVFSGRR